MRTIVVKCSTLEEGGDRDVEEEGEHDKDEKEDISTDLYIWKNSFWQSPPCGGSAQCTCH